MSYSDYPKCTDPEGTDVQPASGREERAVQQEESGVVTGDGCRSIDEVFVRHDLRILAKQYPEFAGIRNRCEELGLDLDPIYALIGRENTLQNFCRQLSNFVTLILYFLEKETSSGAAPLFLLNSSFRTAAERFVRNFPLPGKALVDFISLKMEIQSLAVRLESETSSGGDGGVDVAS
jgi:hypothetical protein